jgi:lipopolysaccharide transport system ATP-binding protein
MGRIIVSHLGKAYKKYPTRAMRLAEALLPNYGDLHTIHWVLKDINFIVEPGEAIGIMGMNGAGKSTLLKMLTGTIIPTEGSVNVDGRVAAILELGMGFHPDFTGRQNVYMAGNLLGHSTEEITRLMPQIEAFAEIGTYIDEPVRVYSSGMQVRLAFSVATASRPDILIVDEALSVGDAYFQHKSFDRIRQFRALGTTLLIVTHDKAAIQSICDKAILLNNGRLVFTGQPEAVIDYYNALLSDREGGSALKQLLTEDGRIQTISGDGEAVIEKIALLNERNEEIEVLSVGQIVRLTIFVKVIQDIPELVVGYMIKDRTGQPMYGTNTHHLKEKCLNIEGGTRLSFTFEFMANLGEGTYSIAIALHTGHTHIVKNYEWRDIALVFNVINVDKDSFVGGAWLPPKVEMKHVR